MVESRPTSLQREEEDRLVEESIGSRLTVLEDSIVKRGRMIDEQSRMIEKISETIRLIRDKIVGESFDDPIAKLNRLKETNVEDVSDVSDPSPSEDRVLETGLSIQDSGEMTSILGNLQDVEAIVVQKQIQLGEMDELVQEFESPKSDESNKEICSVPKFQVIVSVLEPSHVIYNNLRDIFESFPYVGTKKNKFQASDCAIRKADALQFFDQMSSGIEKPMKYVKSWKFKFKVSSLTKDGSEFSPTISFFVDVIHEELPQTAKEVEEGLLYFKCARLLQEDDLLLNDKVCAAAASIEEIDETNAVLDDGMVLPLDDHMVHRGYGLLVSKGMLKSVPERDLTMEDGKEEPVSKALLDMFLDKSQEFQQNRKVILPLKTWRFKFKVGVGKEYEWHSLCLGSGLFDELSFSLEESSWEETRPPCAKNFLRRGKLRHKIFKEEIVIEMFYESEGTSGDTYLQRCLDTAMWLANTRATSTIVVPGFLRQHDSSVWHRWKYKLLMSLQFCSSAIAER